MRTPTSGELTDAVTVGTTAVFSDVGLSGAIVVCSQLLSPTSIADYARLAGAAGLVIVWPAEAGQQVFLGPLPLPAVHLDAARLQQLGQVRHLARILLRIEGHDGGNQISAPRIGDGLAVHFVDLAKNRLPAIRRAKAPGPAFPVCRGACAGPSGRWGARRGT